MSALNLEWRALFAQGGREFTDPDVGYMSSPDGPTGVPASYWPGAGFLLDVGSFKDMRRALGPDADTAQVIVLAHETGHHVQYLLTGQEADSMPIGLASELQADCYAGLAIAAMNRRVVAAGQPVRYLDPSSAWAKALQYFEENQVSPAPSVEVMSPQANPHGSPKERMAHFGRGLAARGLEDC